MTRTVSPIYNLRYIYDPWFHWHLHFSSFEALAADCIGRFNTRLEEFLRHKAAAESLHTKSPHDLRKSKHEELQLQHTPLFSLQSMENQEEL